MDATVCGIGRASYISVSCTLLSELGLFGACAFREATHKRLHCPVISGHTRNNRMKWELCMLAMFVSLGELVKAQQYSTGEYSTVHSSRLQPEALAKPGKHCIFYRDVNLYEGTP